MCSPGARGLAGPAGGRMGTVVAEKDSDGYRVDIPHLLDFADRMMQG